VHFSLFVHKNTQGGTTIQREDRMKVKRKTEEYENVNASNRELFQ
jgi:hypothetical protein